VCVGVVCVRVCGFFWLRVSRAEVLLSMLRVRRVARCCARPRGSQVEHGALPPDRRGVWAARPEDGSHRIRRAVVVGDDLFRFSQGSHLRGGVSTSRAASYDVTEALMMGPPLVGDASHVGGA